MWEAILGWVFNICEWFANLLGDWGLGIIVLTIIFRIILFPLTYKQNKSNYLMQKLQVRMTEIQTLYANDQQKMAAEMQRLYSEAGYNPLTGCLIPLIQMPIFIALFQVLDNIGERVDAGTVLSFYQVIPDLTINAIEAFNVSFVYSIPYFVLVAIFGASILIPTLIQQNRDTTTMVTMVIMTVFMVVLGCQSPAGVVLFWDTSSIIALIVQQLSKLYYQKEDAKKAAEEVKPVQVNVVRKQKKARPTKSH